MSKPHQYADELLLNFDNGGDITNMTTGKIADITTGDSVSLGKIDGQNFTIVAVEQSDFDDGKKILPGVKITTEESFNVDGTTTLDGNLAHNKFHTTRVAIVRQLLSEKMTEQLKSGITFHVRCKKVTHNDPKNQDYFILVDAE